jgi:hypothetical protein
MAADIIRAGGTGSVAVETGDRIQAARFQLTTEDVALTGHAHIVAARVGR